MITYSDTQEERNNEQEAIDVSVVIYYPPNFRMQATREARH